MSSASISPPMNLCRWGAGAVGRRHRNLRQDTERLAYGSGRFSFFLFYLFFLGEQPTKKCLSVHKCPLLRPEQCSSPLFGNNYDCCSQTSRGVFLHRSRSGFLFYDYSCLSCRWDASLNGAFYALLLLPAGLTTSNFWKTFILWFQICPWRSWNIRNGVPHLWSDYTSVTSEKVISQKVIHENPDPIEPRHGAWFQLADEWLKI